ncbi:MULTISPECIES: sugar MFS transporter [unclassified Mucilaginibacter]|uniref:sugar MFS transporter n=1 Tax=unclassified Mucilaginibacter TaxID=2617802 RepID=UPI002AC9232C|nr:MULTISPECIES: sugar MFS transporter [unclassified Mucilaginibacter]MEB0263270.1 sugar MFS transporter [Mucilaginibacter sp. 10I4]MEB0278242.1 sugar MFS transporter [Mucilaginibacter sp. 10B2]MEB0300972.1 sugar MFS transporter [Mucilaginibacter sp. 5C4]WPX23887.1 sugar MFS transporter [Mucilaginibacter sp. 5C4]
MAILPLQTTVVEESVNRQKQNYIPALVALGVLYFMMGLITCLNDTLVPFFKSGFTLSYAQSSLVQFYFFLTYGIMSIPAGKVVEKVGYKKGMVLGFSIAAVGAILFFPASILHIYALFLAALFIVAIGIVILQVAANPYVTVLGPAKTASSRLTMVQGVGSIGTTIAPILGSYFILSQLSNSHGSSEAVRYPYLGIAVMLILIAFTVSRLKLPIIKTVGSQQIAQYDDQTKSVFSFRNLNFGAIAIFLYVGAEVSIGTFLTNYVSDILKIGIKDSNTYVAFYWGSMVVGRLLGALLLKIIKSSYVLSICAAISIFLIVFSVTNTGQLAIWSMISIGFFNSVMFAIIFSLSVNGLGKYTTKASGILSTAIVGGAIISFTQGLLIDHFTWPIAFMLPLLCYLYILFYGLNGYRSKYNSAT